MFRKTIASLVVILFVITGTACAKMLDSSFSLFSVFAGLWTSVTAESDQDYSSGRFFPAIYSDGSWVSSYGVSVDDYMAIQRTSADANARITSISVVGRNGESSYFREMCAFAWLLLENPSTSITDNVLIWLETEASTTDLSDIIKTVDGDYTFSFDETAMGAIAHITTDLPYTVDGHFAVDIEGSYMIPFQQPIKNVIELEHNIILMMEMYGYAEDEIISIGVAPIGSGEYMHTYLLDYTVIGAIAVSEDDDSSVFNVVLNNVQDDPATLVGVSHLVFAALTDMTQEELVSMYYSAAEKTTWNDYLNKLPVFAHDNKMLLFSVQSNGAPGGYIMGVPDGEEVNSSR